MIEAKDIEGRIIKVGDSVYYARKRGYPENGILEKCLVTSIKEGVVQMGKYRSTSPEDQIVIIKSHDRI